MSNEDMKLLKKKLAHAIEQYLTSLRSELNLPDGSEFRSVSGTVVGLKIPTPQGPRYIEKSQ